MKHNLASRIIIVLIFSAAYIQSASANYSTPGTGKVWNLDSLVMNSGGDVTFDAGAYFVNDTVTISVSDTLNISSDFIMKMGPQVFIDVFGVMIIDPPNTGLITAADTLQKFLGLKFEDQSDGSRMLKTIFEHGNGIRMLDCNILIDRCTIRFNTLNSNFSSSAVSLFRSNSVISNCTIYRNRRAAIASSANITSSPRIISNNIFENNTENANVPQINLGAAANDTLIIRGNTITGLFDNCGGISLLPVGSIPIALIENNVIRRNRYGIALGGGNSFVIIRNNIIDSNNIQGVPNLGGSGINFNGSSTQTSIVTGNTIRGNLWGITIQGTAKPNMGNITNSSNEDDGLNRIYWNTNSGSVYDLYNNTPDSIKAENNWWGTDNADSVEAHIFHRADSSTLGFVDYLPLGVITGIVQPEAAPRNYRLNSTAYPNPFNPTVTIRFTLADSELVTLEIYDAAGKKIHSNNGKIFEAGLNIVSLDMQRLAAGVYYYRLSTKRLTESGKLVLLK